ncbi:hypothetical protein F4861DRAFT_330559 [Xylaria intraflava]|nr:hypothetical protein F4861DRAFT_330559 [Xylaria intraflava]
MDDNWPISQPFFDLNTEEASWQINDRPGQVHREDLIGWESRNHSGIKGRLVEVVHGYKDNDEDKPRTLIVFEWRFIPGINAHRIRNVKITVAFEAVGPRSGFCRGDRLSDWDPVPIDWAPRNLVRSHFSRNLEIEAVSTEVGAQVGYRSFAVVGANLGLTTTQVVEPINYRYITGTPTRVNKNAGSRNAMEWQFGENVQLKSGVQHEIRTAVLLQREGYDTGKFKLTVVAETNMWWPGRLIDKLYRTLRLRPTDGPAAFDPTVLPGSGTGKSDDEDVAARPTLRNWRNLDELDLEAELLKDWVVPSPHDTEVDEKAMEAENAVQSLAGGWQRGW